MIDERYAAGFFDGEGSVSILHLSTGTHRLTVVVAQVDRRPLDMLAERWGGKVRPYYRRRPGTRPAWRWETHGAVAAAFLADVRAYLVVKADVADLGLQFAATLRWRGYRVPEDVQELRTELRADVMRRNQRGTG